MNSSRSDPGVYHPRIQRRKRRKNPELDPLERVGPPVTWVIKKSTYWVGSDSDGLPLFIHNGYSYKAAVAGKGSISWYIRCLEYTSNQPCHVQGVRHIDGRLLMLRLHNHQASKIPTPSKRIIDRATATVGKNPWRLKTNLPATHPGKTPLSVPSSIAAEKIVSIEMCDINDKGAEGSSLLFAMKNRWRSARQNSVLKRLRSAVDT